jgi:ribonuclease HI
MDLWIKIVNLLHFHKVKFFWLKGHDNNKFNELADCYANIAAVVINPKEDIKQN